MILLLVSTNIVDYIYHAQIHSWNQPVLGNEG